MITKLVITIIVVTAALAGGWASKFFLGNDNPIEQEAEKIIEENIGYNIDLSQ